MDDDLLEWYVTAKMIVYCGCGLYCIYLLTQNPTLFAFVLVVYSLHKTYS